MASAKVSVRWAVTHVRILNTGANMKEGKSVFCGGGYEDLDLNTRRLMLQKKLEALKVLLLWEQDESVVSALMDISDKWRETSEGEAEGGMFPYRLK